MAAEIHINAEDATPELEIALMRIAADVERAWPGFHEPSEGSDAVSSPDHRAREVIAEPRRNP